MKLFFVLVALVVALTAAPVSADTEVGAGQVGQIESGQATGSDQSNHGVEVGVGTVGDVSEGRTDEGTLPEGERPRVSRQPAPSPRWQTREGVEHAAHRVLRGDFAPRRHSHPTRPSRPVGHKAVYREVKRWNPASCSYVDVKVQQRPATVTNNFNFATPPAEPARAPETPGERKTNMLAGWIILGIFVIGAIVTAIYAIVASNARQIAEQNTRQAQANQLATSLANQAPFAPAAGREVEINASIFPTGGGVVRAKARDAMQPPQIAAVPAPPAPPAAPAPAAMAVVAPVPPPLALPTAPSPAAPPAGPGSPPATPSAAPPTPVTAAGVTAGIAATP